MLRLATAYAAIGLTASGAVVAAAYVAEGFLILVWNVITVSLRQQVVPEAVLGRVNGVYQLLVHGATPLGSLAGGAVAGREPGLRAPFLLTAVAMVVLLAVAARLVTTARIEAAPCRDRRVRRPGARRRRRGRTARPRRRPPAPRGYGGARGRWSSAAARSATPG